MVQVVVVQDGAAASEMENQVTRLVENAVASLPGIEQLASNVQLGVSMTQIQFAIGSDLQKLKDCGAEVVLSTDTGNNLQNALDAAKQLDFNPIWFVTSAVYTTSFADWNVNGNADRVYFGNAFVPLEDTTPGTANAAYVDIVKAHGGDVSYTGQQSASAFLLWATAAKACGNDLTRACVMQQLKEDFDMMLAQSLKESLREALDEVAPAHNKDN